MITRDRIRELRRVKARELIANPRNWRVHPDEQREALRSVLVSIGYADALLVRERGDGKFELIDGHLRASLTPDDEVPVLVLDLNDAEAATLLATLDPLATMATVDADDLESLMKDAQIYDDNLRELLERMIIEARAAGLPETTPDVSEKQLPEIWGVLITCEDEGSQAELLERLTGEGYVCKPIIS
jgi:ParB-like chromosome segregation protein Spo0J